MSEWAVKRFWKEATVEEGDGGFRVMLDGRMVRTPAKALLEVPRADFADAIAGEWRAQDEVIRPLTMPFTRSANAAIDKVAPRRAEVAGILCDYGDTDLLCYRAEGPEGLVQRQAEAWDPALDWADATFGARLEPRTGVMHAPQRPAALERLAVPVREMSAFQLAGLHDLVSLSGSLVLGLGAAFDWRATDDIWALSRIDETWQEEQWGRDDEAHAAAEVRRREFAHAKRVFDLSGPE